jgi:hypothetical protein
MVRSPRARAALALLSFGLAVSAQAITFTNVIIQSPPLSTGSSWSAIGNSISFFTPNAIVGDVVDPLRSGTLNIQYDATNFGNNVFAVGVTVNLAAVSLGSGMIQFGELIFELDSNGNEVGGPIGTISHTFDANSGTFWSGNIVLSRPVAAFRAKKFFVMTAPDTQTVDLAALAVVNQSVQVIPEPATLGALGIGAAALLALRRRR